MSGEHEEERTRIAIIAENKEDKRSQEHRMVLEAMRGKLKKEKEKEYGEQLKY